MKTASIPMKTARTLLTCVVLFCLTCALARAQEEVTVKGLIVSRTGDSMILRTADDPNRVVILDDETKVQSPKGLFKARHERFSMAELIPGLQVTVKGTTDAKGQLVAKKVEFRTQDLKTANAIQAGLVPTEQSVQANKQAIGTNREQIAANKEQIGVAQEQITANQKAVEQRFSDLSDYEIKDTADVFFQSGSAELSDKAKTDLLRLATNASNNTGYLIQVKGYCDSTGTAAQNQVLSRDRAEAVVAFLLQSGKVPLRHILAPGAMSTVEPAASNESPEGRAKNRRVEVKTLVNKGLASK